MTKSRSVCRIALATTAMAAATLVAAPAFSCVVVSRQPTDAPKLAHERVAVVFDRVAQQQHLVREVRFDDANGKFGFIVPLPSMPTVHKTGRSFFSGLAKKFPFEKKAPPKGYPPGAKAAARPATPGQSVTVFKTKRVGSFVASILQASDPDALANWLRDHGFSTSPAQKRWFAGFVRARFYFAAFKYAPKAPAARSTDDGFRSESVRLSFASPVAYFPFSEPSDTPRRSARLLELWTLGTEPVIPVAYRSTAPGRYDLRRPWRAGQTYSPARTQVAAAIGYAPWLPKAKTLKLQTFRDTRTARIGWGDVLFAQAKQTALSADELDARRRLLPLLDPRLAEGQGTQ